MVDCSHANSGKDHVRQAAVACGGRAARWPAGSAAIVGVMMESFLVDGRQDHEGRRQPDLRPEHHRRLHGWERTEPLLDAFAEAVRSRRKALAATA